MSNLLFLARDYIERMANPIHGTAVNEDYALRFASLLGSKAFEVRLAQEIERLTDRSTLTSYGWFWLLGWVRAKDIKLNQELLVELYEEWSSVFVRTTIIELATHNANYGERRNQVSSIEEFPNLFLRTIMRQATRRPERIPPRSNLEDRESTKDTQPKELTLSTAMAESTLLALLQTGTPITIDAARSMLQYEWPGRERLLVFFWGIYEALDEDTRYVWQRVLNPPERPTG